jgi:protein-tyrosine-phosphatase
VLRREIWGDYRVRELTHVLGERQSLVSYHLGILHTGGLVAARQSSADGRELYYRTDLDRCAQVLIEAGAALHVGLRLQARQASPAPGGLSGRVLFLCTGNSSRSQMAEAFIEQLSGGAIQAASAGSQPGQLHPNTVAVMRQYGFDLANRRTNSLQEFADQQFDYVITLCDRVREVCPEFPEPARRLHWSMANPAEASTNDQESYPAFESTAAQLAMRIPLFLELLSANKEAA